MSVAVSLVEILSYILYPTSYILYPISCILYPISYPNLISEEVTKMARTTEIIIMHFTDFKTVVVFVYA